MGIYDCARGGGRHKHGAARRGGSAVRRRLVLIAAKDVAAFDARIGDRHQLLLDALNLGGQILLVGDLLAQGGQVA